MRLLTLIAALSFSLGSMRAWARDQKICDDLLVRADEDMAFNVTERQFLCGDRQNPPWADPPQSQVKLFLVSFLQTRGYFQPQFSRQGLVMVVDVGEKTRIKYLGSSGVPPEVNFKRFWVPARKPLTPSLLDEYEDLLSGRIQSQGYPCPKVRALAIAADKSMVITAEPGPRQQIAKIDEEEIEGLRPHILRRYFPFTEGDWFNGDLVQIANARIKAEDILASSYMISRCGDDGAIVTHRAAAGTARRMSVGIGVNTETLFLLRSTYRNARVDENASRFEAILSTNYYRQRLQSSLDWYFLPFPTSVHIKPELALEHRKEQASEMISTIASIHLGAYGDLWGQYWRLYTGPNLNWIRTVRGRGPSFARIIEWELSGKLMSHAFEFYRGSPRTGYQLDWRLTTASRRTFSTESVDTVTAQGETLFNLLSLDPPLLVFGVRGGIFATDAAPGAQLPDQYLYYLGGSEDLRGFPRRTVPSRDLGARSAAYAGTEARLVTVVPYNLQPFVFLDVGLIGNRAFTFEMPYYYSPGVGLRWQSPIGSIRGSIARGYLVMDDKGRSQTVPAGWTGILSFGEEF